MELFIYLAKVSGCTAAFYLAYHILFRKLTFFTLNRWYLLSALAISLFIPLLHIGITTTLPAADVKPVIVNTAAQTIQNLADVAPQIIAQQPEYHANWLLIATIAYCSIAALLLLKLLVVVGGILYKAIKYGERDNGYKLIKGRSANNSSFFRCLFLNNTGLDDKEQQQVIHHELMHARLLHSVDNLFTEILKAVLWANPFVYLFSKALHQAHEFEVDRHLALQYNSKSYASLLFKLSNPAMAGLRNQFSAYGLKTRIQMLFCTQSAAAKKLSYLLVVPVIAGLVYFFAIERVYAFSDVTGFVLVLDAGHGGNTGATGNGVNEQDITLTMVKQIKTIAEAKGIKVILTRSDNTNVPLADRVKPHADAFVSIHVNSMTGKQANSTSGMLIITDRLDTQAGSQMLADAFIDQMKNLKGITMSDKVYRQGIKVLRENKEPAILLELGYLTNKNDLKYITDAQNQHTIAEKCVDAVIAYKNSVATNAAGMHRLINKLGLTNAKAKVNGAAQPNIAQNTFADSAIKVKGPKAGWGTTSPHKGHLNSINMQLLNEEGDAKDKMYNDFKQVRSTATDSSTIDRKTGAVRLYKGELITAKMVIKADYILYDLKDSLISANGRVRMTALDGKKTNGAPMVIETDTLNISLKNYPARSFSKRH